jgi:hypothetical protein
VAEWNDVALWQWKPPALTASSNVDIGALTTAVLRALGMNPEAALRFGHRMTTAPALLLGIGEEEAVNVREVSLRTGPATMIEDSTTMVASNESRFFGLWQIVSIC